KGGDTVTPYIPSAIISAVNMVEVISYMVNRGMDASEVKALVRDLTIEVIPFDNQQAFIAGEMILKTKQKGLSLADRACLALTTVKKLPVLTGDKVWGELNLDIEIKLIR